ncbi:ABC transporter ATP-binding protein [Corynebacterium guangdongense]|uniref:ABC-type sugar transport system ATPase subunit n=1 Tax=Corynebacterium guangdongense TaxID=1783348 RepID=A0ABU1ZZX4_9CORY|nr:sn-glycerol-3-phosphate ABC transporter ATP-binding protein UgpC [Corynebacterium guangdongense]MDR7330481.1 ABC-type sugar transport system ATPase subunit [Corynebacterium guangdongense]WJZ19037.1 Trehalose import ATP-binding protein SugC [Corynebacterium guangdongense]
MASITFDSVSRIYTPGARPAVNKIDLDVADGEFLVLVGPSGCGKSTTLRMLAGLEPIDEGRLLLDGQDATALRPQDRDIAMVFQSYALYPNMTVRDNMGFALKNQKYPKAEIAARVQEASRILQLDEYLDRKPGALSGGQRQRVAMGRAIVREPSVFCMDEPLSNLDAKLRVSTRAEISALQRRMGVTTVYVTHDQVEAMTMGDRVAVLLAGVLQQVDTPQNLYDRPTNVFVASFIGSPSMNLIKGRLGDGVVSLGTGVDIHLDEVARRAPELSGHANANRAVVVGARPEHMYLTAEGDRGAIRAVISHIDELGADSMVYVKAAGVKNPDSDILGSGVPADMRIQVTDAGEHDQAELGVRVERHHGLSIGDVVHVAAAPENLHVFDGREGQRLNP